MTPIKHASPCNLAGCDTAADAKEATSPRRKWEALHHRPRLGVPIPLLCLGILQVQLKGLHCWERISRWRIRGSKCRGKCSVVSSLPLALGLLMSSWLQTIFCFAGGGVRVILKGWFEKRASVYGILGVMERPPFLFC